MLTADKAERQAHLPRPGRIDAMKAIYVSPSAPSSPPAPSGLLLRTTTPTVVKCRPT
jgi:hypothetical protein